LQVPLLHDALTRFSLPKGISVPSSAVGPWDAQPHFGYCWSQMLSAVWKRACSLPLIAMMSSEPQQLVVCRTSTQSASLAQLLSKVGKVGLLPVQLTSPGPEPPPESPLEHAKAIPAVKPRASIRFMIAFLCAQARGCSHVPSAL
jgi:hypothetical protein